MHIEQGVTLWTLPNTFNQGTRHRFADLVSCSIRSACNATLAQGSSLNQRLAARKGLTGLVHVLYPTGKSDPCAQTYRFISCCEKRRSDTACVRSCPLSSIECGDKYVEGNHIIIQGSGEASDNNNIKYEIHGIIGTRTSRKSRSRLKLPSPKHVWTFRGIIPQYVLCSSLEASRPLGCEVRGFQLVGL